MKRFVPCLLAVAISPAAFAQYAGGVNVDFNVAAGAGAGQPTILFGGAAAQGGYWNSVNPPYNSGTSVTLRNLANSANAVTMTYSWGGAVDRAAFSSNHPETSGDTELLLDDCFDIPPAGQHTFTVGPFAPGLYRVVTYAVTPDSGTSRTDITVNSNQAGSIMTFGGTQTVGGPIPVGGAPALGITHAQHTVPMYADGSIIIHATTSFGFGAVNGFQIQRLAPTRLYVRRGGVVLGTGLSWDEPFDNLQTALHFARNTPSVTEIWVAGGTYFSDESPETANNRNAAFTLRSNLTIYGGFAGTEVGLSQRSPANAPTILSGHGLAYHTVLCDNVTNVTIDGVTIADGFNDLDNHAWGYFAGGAGVFVQNGASDITIQGCRFINNQTPLGGSTCLSIANAGPVYVDRCTTRDNVGEAGVFAGLFGGTLGISRCTLAANRVTGPDFYSGSLIDGGPGASLYISDSLLANNDVKDFLIYCPDNTLLDMRNCTVANNRAQPGAPGIHGPSNTRLHNCILYGNVGPGPITRPLILQLAGGPGVPWVTDNIIQADDGAFGTNVGNLDVDPRFIAPAAPGAPAVIGTEIDPLGYRLASRSPARDSGWNGGASVFNTDLLSNPRFYNDVYFPNSGPDGSTVDRGCYEMQTPSDICPGDVGRQGGIPGPDGLRDNNDFVVFINFFFAPDARADLGSQGGIPPGDGVYDNNDFVVFINFFFAPCP